MEIVSGVSAGGNGAAPIEPAPMEGALEGEGLPVGNGAEPTGPQGTGHASSASQSRVSMMVWMWWRNLEA